jgi:hypothetical protein
MGLREGIRNGFRQGIKGFASGCLTHLSVSFLALVLIAVFAHYSGLSDDAAFAIAFIAVALISILVPWEKRERQ